MTVTALDGAGFSDSTTFTWTITNTLTVTYPGGQTVGLGHGHHPGGRPGDGLAPVPPSRGRPPACRPGCRSTRRPGRSPGRPPRACTYPVTVTATDGSGLLGTATFTWTVTNTVTVTGPGDQSDVSGSAVTRRLAAADSSSAATLTCRPPGLPAGLSIDPRPDRHRDTDDGRNLVGDRDGHGQCRLLRVGVVLLDGDQQRDRTGPGAQTDVSGTAISPVTVGATDSSSTATDHGRPSGLPAGLSIDTVHRDDLRDTHHGGHLPR